MNCQDCVFNPKTKRCVKAKGRAGKKVTKTKQNPPPIPPRPVKNPLPLTHILLPRPILPKEEAEKPLPPKGPKSIIDRIAPKKPKKLLDLDIVVEEPVKRGRGRPKKN